MKLFKDSNGQEWRISVTLALIEDLRSSYGVDLLDQTGEIFDRLSTDLFLLGRVLWRFCEKQATDRGVTPEQFVEAVAGDPFDAAVKAIIEDVANFFPRQRRLLLQRASATMREVRQRGEAIALAKLDDPNLMTRMEEAMTTRMESDMMAALTRLNSAGN